MECDEFKKLAERLVFEKGDAAWPIPMTQHLAQCSGCRKEMQAYRKTWQLLDELPKVELAADYFERFQQRLASRTLWHQSLLEGVRNAIAPRWAVPAITAALAAVVVLAVVSLTGYYSSRPEVNVATDNEVEIELLANLDLVVDFDVIKDLDLLSDMEIIAQLNGAS